ncbi:hypothetical protein QTP88_010821 [Uroleucon formosanum]
MYDVCRPTPIVLLFFYLLFVLGVCYRFRIAVGSCRLFGLRRLSISPHSGGKSGNELLRPSVAMRETGKYYTGHMLSVSMDLRRAGLNSFAGRTLPTTDLDQLNQSLRAPVNK